MFEIGQRVRYISSERDCVIIATKEVEHRYKFGVEELDNLGAVRPVTKGYDYTIVEMNVEFSPYIDVMESELRLIGL